MRLKPSSLIQWERGQPPASSEALRLWCTFALSFLLFATTAGAQGLVLSERYADGTSALASGDWARAISSFEAVVEAEPSHVPAWFNLALALGTAGETDRAIEAYRKVLTLDPDVFEAHMNIAILLQAESRVDEALIAVSEGTRLRPEDPTAALFRATLLDDLDRIDDAVGAYDRAIALGAGEAEPYWRLGMMYRRTGHTPEAVDALREAVRLGTNEVSVFVALGDIAIERSSLEDGRAYYQHALDLGTEDPDVKLRLALVLDELGMYDAAVVLLEDLEDDLEDAEPLLAEAYLDAGRPDAARTAYEELVRAVPGDAAYWMGLAHALYALDMSGEAEDPLDHVLGIEPDHPEALGMLGAIYHQRGDFEAASRMFLRRLELVPDDALSHLMAATAFDNMANTEEALLHYNKFLELDDGSNDARTFQVRQRAQFLEETRD